MTFHLRRTLGTPSDETWPGVVSLPEFKSSFPRWKQSSDLSSLLNDRMRDDAMDILLVRFSSCDLDVHRPLVSSHRKCSSTIQCDAYQRSNASVIPTSNNSIRKIYLSRHPLLFLWWKREPSDPMYVCACQCLCVNLCVSRVSLLRQIFFCSFSSNWDLFFLFVQNNSFFPLNQTSKSTYTWLFTFLFVSFSDHRSHTLFF